ncbi:MAG TPA: L-2-hydroxyglutarate oxidase [Thermoanaerobaculia bacterium]|nr:L-2-hydroxyglutarate oxidase [Thermoanaerobaculia bacterium]
MTTQRFDIAIVGGGIIGLAAALALARETRARTVVVEAEDDVARHQTGHNSGVIHSGLYYKPGSRKARECVLGRRALVELCAEHSVPHQICGKLVVATEPEEIPRLDELERRGHANGLAGLRRLDASEIAEHEPHATGLAALWVPETGIVDFVAVARTYARLYQEAGGEIRLRHRVIAIRRERDGLAIETTGGAVAAAALVNCGGLQCDRVARMAGDQPGVRIVPFRGEYFELVPERRHLVRGLIYPVPDPRFPFLGVHLTRGVGGEVEAGPNAVLALDRHGYRPGSFNPRDALSSLTYAGFWRMAARHWRMGLDEMRRSGSKRLFAESLRRFVPEIRAEDLTGGGSGIRAQAMDGAGRLLDDFHFVDGERTVHVLNAPSPAATASLAIGAAIARRARERFLS